jgi:type VI protein secretion system component VasK
MDPVLLATTTLTVLAPFLTKMGEKAAEEIGQGLPSAVGKLWNRIGKKFKGNPAAEAAVKDAAANPQDEDNLAALRKEIKKALAADAEFAREIEELLKQAQEETQTLRGNHNIAANIDIGGDVDGNIIIGDNNRVG